MARVQVLHLLLACPSEGHLHAAVVALAHREDATAELQAVCGQRGGKRERECLVAAMEAHGARATRGHLRTCIPEALRLSGRVGDEGVAVEPLRDRLDPESTGQRRDPRVVRRPRPRGAKVNALRAEQPAAHAQPRLEHCDRLLRLQSSGTHETRNPSPDHSHVHAGGGTGHRAVSALRLSNFWRRPFGENVSSLTG